MSFRPRTPRAADSTLIDMSMRSFTVRSQR
jgi:hypothetical protein